MQLRPSRAFRLDESDREIFRLALPALGALVAEPLYVLTDTAIVGHLGTPQLAGLSLASGILLTAFAVFIFLAYGTTAAVARRIGAGQPREAAHDAVQALWLAALIGGALLAVGLPTAGPLVRAMGHDRVVEHYAYVYLRISLFGLPAQLVTFAGVGYLRGTQDTRKPLLIAVAAAVLNLVLEVVLVYGFDQGLGASAAGTVVAQWVAAAWYVDGIRQAVAEWHVRLAPAWRTIVRLAVVGRDLFVRTLALRGSFLVGTIVAAHIGTTDLAAYEVVFAVWAFSALALDALAIAGQAIVGRCLGAGDAVAAQLASSRMIRWATLGGLAFGIVMITLRVPLAAVFTDDPAVRNLAAFGLVLVGLMQPIGGAVFALDGILIGAGDQRYLAWSMSAVGVAFTASALVVLAAGGGIGWLWGAVGVLTVGRFVGLWPRYRTNRWATVGA
jgi:putative MATE family efflux protein